MGVTPVRQHPPEESEGSLYDGAMIELGKENFRKPEPSSNAYESIPRGRIRRGCQFYVGETTGAGDNEAAIQAFKQV